MKSKAKEKKSKDSRSAGHILGNIVGAVVCMILIPVLIANIVLIAKGYMNKNEVPSLGGYMPLIVLTDSMYPNIQSGDLIICRTADADSIQVGDVISFFDPEGDGTSVVSHRVIEITSENGETAFRTQGDANNAEDAALVPASNLVGVYQTRIAGAGNVAMFMQTTMGLVICVILPLILLVGYDIVRRRMYERNRKDDTEALMKELEELRARQKQAS